MKVRTPTADLLARAFADAVARGEDEAAEGWLTLAATVQARWSRPRTEGRAITTAPPAPGHATQAA